MPVRRLDEDLEAYKQDKAAAEEQQAQLRQDHEEAMAALRKEVDGYQVALLPPLICAIMPMTQIMPISLCSLHAGSCF